MREPSPDIETLGRLALTFAADTERAADHVPAAEETGAGITINEVAKPMTVARTPGKALRFMSKG